MKRIIVLLAIVLLCVGCAWDAKNLKALHYGMTHAEVEKTLQREANSATFNEDTTIISYYAYVGADGSHKFDLYFKKDRLFKVVDCGRMMPDSANTGLVMVMPSGH